MTSRRTTSAELEALILETTRGFDTTTADKWQRYSVAPFEHALVTRISGTSAEQVYVVARRGRRVVYYDDVEEEFAVGFTDDRRYLSDLSLYGELSWALQGL